MGQTASAELIRERHRDFEFIDTRHFRISNITSRLTVCGCGHDGELYSYDARAWRSLRAIPIFPLGPVHVIDACPRCGHYQEMPLEEYRAMGGRVLRESLERVEQDPANLRTAEMALDAADRYDDRELLLRLVDQISRNWPRHPAVQWRIAKVFERLGLPDKAELAYKVFEAFSSRPSSTPSLQSRALSPLRRDSAEGRTQE